MQRIFQPTHAARSAGVRHAGARRAQGGVVLLVALVFLVVVSLLAATSLRNAASSESVLGNVRTTDMATQAADIALRHCEASVLDLLAVAAGSTSAYDSSFKATDILPLSDPPQWQGIGNWDGASALSYVLPLNLVNQTGIRFAAYKRPPECMVEPVPVLLAGASAVNTRSSFVVTARGFGPEVAAADAGRSHPVGSEVWLQSHIQIQ
jgi:type IV pilus assembly protein PilX